MRGGWATIAAVWLAVGCATGDGEGSDDVGKTDTVDTDPEPVCVDEIPYDGIDQDCDGADLADVDEDGFDAEQAGGTDCDDDDPDLNPDAADVPYDGIDQDCDGEDLIDADGDGDPAIVAGGTDCDDDDAAVYPAALDQVGDAIDENCDGLDGIDADADGYASGQSGGSDCNDGDAAQNPAATEVWYDGVDQDCDQVCDYDADGDGAVLAGTQVINNTPCDQVAGPEVYAPEDCDDADPTIGLMYVQTVSPYDGESDVLITSDVLVTLSGADPTAAITVTDVNNVAVPGASVMEGNQVVRFTPDAPLAFGTAYITHLSYACGQDDFRFVTEVAAVPVDPTALPGKTYNVDLMFGDWVEPPGVGDLFAFAAAGSGMLVDVLAADATTLDLRVAPAFYGVQDVCLETADALGASFVDNPTFTASPPALSLVIYGVYVPVDHPELSGRFSANASSIDRLVFSGAIDTRPLNEPLLGVADDSATCDLIGAFGVSCVECLDGTGPYCMQVRLEDVPAYEVAVDPVPRTAADIAADASCP